MNLIYLRTHTPRARRFMKKKLRRGEPASVYGIEAGDCCLAPAAGRKDYLLTFVHDVSPEMLDFMYRSAAWKGLAEN